MGHDGREWWYVIRRGDLRGAVPAVPSEAAARAVERLWNGDGREDAERLLLVSAWFRKRPGERQRTMKIEDVLTRCRMR